MEGGAILLAVLVVLALGIWLYLRFHLRMDLWLAARAAGVPLPFSALTAMRFRRVMPEKIVFPYIKAHKAGVKVRLTDLEALVIAGGDPMRVVDALILAHERDFPLSFMDCVKSSLSGEDPCAFVKQHTTSI